MLSRRYRIFPPGNGASRPPARNCLRGWLSAWPCDIFQVERILSTARQPEQGCVDFCNRIGRVRFHADDPDADPCLFDLDDGGLNGFLQILRRSFKFEIGDTVGHAALNVTAGGLIESISKL